MTHIDLFSGIGGFALAAHWAGFTTKVFCEKDEFCQQVLGKHWPSVPIVGDIHQFDGTRYRGAALLTGGFPCQPFSCAGKQRGASDDRFLWPEMLRIIREARPTWIVGENVAGIINMALDGVLADLENEGYATQAFVIPACGVKAPHKRDRVWIVAHAGCSNGDGRAAVCAWNRITDGQRFKDRKEAKRPPIGGDKDAMADATQFTQRKPADQTVAFATSRQAWDESGYCRQPAPDPNRQPSHGTTEPRGQRDRWQFIPGLGDVADGLPARLAGHFDAEPAIPRIATGIPQRAAQLKALGNAIVPQVAYEILRHIQEIQLCYE